MSRTNYSNRVSNRVRAVRGWCVKRTTHASPPMWRLPRSEFFDEKNPVLPQSSPREDVLAPKRGWCV